MKPIPLVAFMIVDEKSVLAECGKSPDSLKPDAIWIPGGRVESNETDEQAFLRETKDELDINPTHYFSLCTLPWEKNGKSYSIHYYVCTKWSGEMESMNAWELILVRPPEINKMSEEVDRQAIREYFQKASE